MIVMKRMIAGFLLTRTLAVVALMSAASGRPQDDTTLAPWTSCGQPSFLHPYHGIVACNTVCPPARTTDISIHFCSINCAGKFGSFSTDIRISLLHVSAGQYGVSRKKGGIRS